jgi:PAS domain S-box-containing protein
LICDATLSDLPITHVSKTFEETTGYYASEIMGKNCRFLQAPGGQVEKGSVRKYSDGSIIFHMKSAIQAGQECQFSLVNYRKNCDPFINLVTVIPICYYTEGLVSHYVGLQIDLIEQPESILERMGDGSYYVNYQRKPSINYIFQQHQLEQAQPEEEIPLFLSKFIDNCGDFVHILSIRGIFLYTSPKSLREVLGYESKDFQGKNISEFVHPSDLVFVMRELRSAASNEAINIVCRFQRKFGKYVYVELRGHVYEGESGKRTRCIVMTGREKKLGRISVSDILYPDLEESWAKISPEGLFLFNDTSSERIFKINPKGMYAKSLFDFVAPEHKDRVRHSLQVIVAAPPYTDLHDLDLILPGNGRIRVHIRIYNDSESIPRYLYCQIKLLMNTFGGNYSISTGTLSEFASMFKNGNIFDFMEKDDSGSFYYEINQLKVQNNRLKEQLELITSDSDKYSDKKNSKKNGSSSSTESSRSKPDSSDSPIDSSYLSHQPYHRQQDVPSLLYSLFE